MLVAVAISALAMSLALRPAAADAINIQDGVNSSSVGEMVVTIAPDGLYFRCRGIVSNDGVSTGAGNGGTVTSDVECYWDNAGITINAVKAAASSCPPDTVLMGQPTMQIPQRLCGDGLGADVTSTPCYWNCAGGAPRTQFGARPDGRGDLSYVPAGGHTFKGTYNRGPATSNEVQTVALSNATGGTFTLTFDDTGSNPQQTAAIAYDASAATVQSALEGLPNVGPGNVQVTGAQTFGGPYRVTLKGALAGTNYNQMTADGSALTRNEVQSVTVDATGGTFKLTFDDTGSNPQQTPSISESATAAQVESALEALSNVGSGNVDVGTTGGAFGGPYRVTFKGTLANTNYDQMTADSSALTGGAHTVTTGTITNGGTPTPAVTTGTIVDGGLSNPPGDDQVKMEGCFSTQNTFWGGPWYFVVTLNYSATSTATGSVEIYTQQPAHCGGSPSGGGGATAPVALTENEAVTPSTDPNAAVQTSTTNYDGDSCTDVRELGANKGKGGLRDPLNSYDAWDLTGDKKATVADILALVNHFGGKETDATAVGTHAGNPFTTTPAGIYSAAYDRGSAGGGTAVNLGPGNGQITVADVLGIVSQFGMNCS